MMINYAWKGILLSGEKARGHIEAINVINAKNELRKRGIITRKISKRHIPILRICHPKIQQSSITQFIRQLSILSKAGIPLIKALHILEQGATYLTLKNLIKNIRQDIETGLMLAAALRRHPRVFNDFFCNMIDAGEKSGTLDLMIERITIHKENIERLRKKIYKALAYPFAVIIIAVLVICALLLFVIPQFKQLFSDFGADLPILTQCIISVSEWMSSYWPMIVCVSLLLIYAGAYIYKHFLCVAHHTHIILLKIPFVGELLQKLCVARFARTLSITCAAGMPLTHALTSTAISADSNIYTEAIYKIRDEIINGQSIHKAMQYTNRFPEMVIQMIIIGEESGQLEYMLNKIADIYDEEIAYFVDNFNQVLEPLLMVVLGIFVGGIVIAMYLPILTLGTVI